MPALTTAKSISAITAIAKLSPVFGASPAFPPGISGEGCGCGTAAEVA